MRSLIVLLLLAVSVPHKTLADFGDIQEWDKSPQYSLRVLRNESWIEKENKNFIVNRMVLLFMTPNPNLKAVAVDYVIGKDKSYGDPTDGKDLEIHTKVLMSEDVLEGGLHIQVITLIAVFEPKDKAQYFTTITGLVVEEGEKEQELSSPMYFPIVTPAQSIRDLE